MNKDTALDNKAAVKTRGLIVFALLVSFVFTGCAAMPFYKQLDACVMAGDYAGADGIVEKSKDQYAGENELLYFFDKGSLLQLLGQYEASSQFLDKAQDKIESLYTKSVTKELASYFVNDMKLPYEGEDFEKIMVSGMKALNYMYAGQFNDTLTAVRKANNVMNLINDRNEGKNIYKEDAFIRYLSAFAYEAKGEIDDAYIDYKKAEKDYEDYQNLYGSTIPDVVKRDVLRLADAVGNKDDVEEFQKKWGNINFNNYKTMKKYGEVLVVIYDGMAPYKVSKTQSATVYENEKDRTGAAVISVAFPHFVERGYVVTGAEAWTGTSKYSSYIGEDISKIAVRTLEDKNLMISAKAIARAAAKYFAGKAIRDKAKSGMMDLLTNIYNYASEQADTRSWRTLPARFHFIRVPLNPGKQSVRVVLYDTTGASREKIIEVKIKAGEKKVVPVFAFN